MTTLHSSLLTFALIVGSSAALAQSEALCFDQNKTAQIVQLIPGLALNADTLARQQMETPGVSGEQVYILTRQVTFFERMHRRLLTHEDFACATALDGIRRDLAILVRTNKALQNGDKELDIKMLEEAGSVELLKLLDEGLTQVQALVETLAPPP